MKAFLKNYRQSPRKVRLVASLVRGKDVSKALTQLDFIAKRSSTPIKNLLLSAVANAKNQGVEIENLYIKEIRVDKGVTLKRIMPRAMGSASRINKRTSQVALVLGEKSVSLKKDSKTAKKETKPKVTKRKTVKEK